MDVDVVIPKNNEESFIDMALYLGYDTIIFLTDDMSYAYDSKRINIQTGYLLKNPSEKHLAKKRFDYVFALADRKYFELGVDFILGAEYSEMKDSFHYKRTSLNHVHAKLARDKGIVLITDFSLLLNSDMKRKQIIVGRMFQNVKLSKKYHIKNRVFSMAVTPQNMRSRTILDSLQKVLSDS